MKDDKLSKGIIEGTEPSQGGHLSPLELIRLHGGRAHKVRGMAARGADSMIAVYKDRFTYTFVMKNEVASIHFDRKRNKIFFSGHNIRNMDLTSDQKGELFKVVDVLESDEEGRELKEVYQATLGSQLADNK